MSFPNERSVPSTDNVPTTTQMEARLVEGSSSNDQIHELQDNICTALHDQIIQEGKKASTNLDGINIVDSFKLPGDLPRAGLDIENLVPTDNGIRESIAGRVRRFSFAERLKGWKIKCTKRKSGSRTDKLYTHKNCVNFRSAVEVVTFILYEAYPSDRPPKREAQVNAEELMVDEEELMVDDGLFEGLEPLNGRVFDLPEV